MEIDTKQIEQWLQAEEVEHLEFKAARNDFGYNKLLDYCGAMANEGGGWLVLGVTNHRPREVCGTRAFPNLNEKKHELLRALHLRIETTELHIGGKRVVVFSVPSRPVGRPVAVNGRYRMRSGESLVDMTPDRLEDIFAEATPDFSASVCAGASMDSLDPDLIQRFRAKWAEKSGRIAKDSSSNRQTLEDAELLIGDEITVAAVVLFGTRRTVTRLMPHAETVFEYRNSPNSIGPQQRQEFHSGCFGYLDALWELIDLRNEQHQLRQGLFVYPVKDLNESVVREALLNAFTHRDYQNPGSIWVRQSPHRLEIVSPGGFPPGITPSNITRKQHPRNRRISEALQKCGLVERGNQGAKLMFQQSIREGKQPPDYSLSDKHQVSVQLVGTVEPRFLEFLNRVGKETRRDFELEDLLVLRRVYEQQAIPDDLKESLRRMREAGLVETTGRGKGTKYLLSRSLYTAIGEGGAYTRKTGLDEEEKRMLVLKHIRTCGDEGCAFSEIQQVVPTVSRSSLKRLLDKLKVRGLIRSEGKGKGARWKYNQT